MTVTGRALEPSAKNSAYTTADTHGFIVGFHETLHRARVLVAAALTPCSLRRGGGGHHPDAPGGPGSPTAHAARAWLWRRQPGVSPQGAFPADPFRSFRADACREQPGEPGVRTRGGRHANAPARPPVRSRDDSRRSDVFD